jgi:hypothetical protein
MGSSKSLYGKVDWEKACFGVTVALAVVAALFILFAVAYYRRKKEIKRKELQWRSY